MKISYETSTYDWLCFKHAVEQANKGFDVQTEIVTDIENYMGSTYCPRCREEMKKDEQLKDQSDKEINS